MEFRLFEWGTYSGTFDGASSPLWVSGTVRSLASAVVLTGAFGALGLRAA